MSSASTPIPLDLAAARELALRAAAGFPGRYRAGLEGVLDAIEAVGFVQIDTISVVERAHHHILWSRVPGYGRGMIAELEGDPRRVLEYWAHAACYLPMRDYRFCLPRMERVRTHGHDWYRCDRRTVAAVRDRIAAEGPLEARHFAGGRRRPGGWWDHKPAKRALEYLHQAGELVTVTRVGFRKVYDLAERHIGAEVDARMPTEDEMGDWYVRSAARAFGLFARDEVAYQRKELLGGVDRALARLVEAGELVGAELVGANSAGAARRPYWVDAGLLESLSKAALAPPSAGLTVHILSPFDPLLIVRKRFERLFGARYTLECYLPEAKRSFGYFALPLLSTGPDGGRFAGLMDAKADRKSRTLVVNRLSVEPPTAAQADAAARKAERETLLQSLAEAIASYARFNGAQAVGLGPIEAPGGAAFARRLRAAVGKALR